VWQSWPPKARQTRLNTIHQHFAECEHFRQYLKSPDATIARQARHEFTRALRELTEAGGLMFDGHRRIT
jgi:hypothetical protein